MFKRSMEKSNSDDKQEEYTMKLQSVSGLLLNGCVDPGLVPRKTLHAGAQMPAIGLGTFGSDHVAAVETAAVVESAAIR